MNELDRRELKVVTRMRDYNVEWSLKTWFLPEISSHYASLVGSDSHVWHLRHMSPISGLETPDPATWTCDSRLGEKGGFKEFRWVREKFQFLSLAAGIGGLLNFREDQKQCPLIKCAIAKGGQRTMDGDGLSENC